MLLKLRNAWQRWRRPGSAFRIIFFSLLPVLPFLVIYEDYDRTIAVSSLAVCFLAGVVLDSRVIMFMIVGALCGFFFPTALRETDRVFQMFGGGVIGFFVGLFSDFDRSLEQQRTASGVADDMPPRPRINWWRVAVLVIAFFIVAMCCGLPQFGSGVYRHSHDRY